MSDIFALDLDGQSALKREAALNPLDLSQADPGWFGGITKSTGMGTMRGGAEAADAMQTFGRFFDPPGADREAADELAADIHHTSVDYWTPGPAETGKVGQVLGGLSEIVLPLMVGGGNPSLLIGTETNKVGKQLVDQGVDADAATEVAMMQGAATAIGFKLPFLGSTLTRRIASGAGGNLLVNAGASGLQQQVLQAAGEEEAALQFDPGNLEARAIDVLTGIAFGGLAHLQMRPSDRAAVAAANNAKHFQHDTAPGAPLDVNSSVAHQKAMDQATEQLLRGEPVTPPVELADATFVRVRKPEPIAIDDPHIAALAPDQQATLRKMYRSAVENKAHFDEQINAIADEIGGKPLLAKLKSVERSVEKTLSDYSGDASRVKDITRATVISPDLVGAHLAIESARAKFGEPIGLRNTLDPNVEPSSQDGYRDIKFNVMVNGHLAEVQVNVPEMLQAKAKAHPIYEAAQSVERRWVREDRDPTPAEAVEYKALREQQRQIYAAALDKFLTKARNADSETSVPLRSNDVTGNLRPSDTSQARQTSSSVQEQGTPSTSANTVPAGKEAGNINTPPTGGIVAPGTPEVPTAAAFDISAAQRAIEINDLQVATGDFGPDGSPVTVSARELMAKAQADLAQAQHDSKAFEAAASCFLQGGGQ